MNNQNSTELVLPLTAKEKAVLEFIEEYIEAHGISPSFNEIREHFGLASYNSVQRYLQQLQNKKYVYVPSGNHKRAITITRPTRRPTSPPPSSFLAHPKKETPLASGLEESLSLPLLGKVAAGLPIEAKEDNEFIQVPANWIRYPERTYALRVQGQSMIDEGILDGDVIFVQQQSIAPNGATVVAMVNNQATVKKFYLHNEGGSDHEDVNLHTDGVLEKVIHSYPQVHTQNSLSCRVELRPANEHLSSMWFSPEQVQIQGIVVGLFRNF